MSWIVREELLSSNVISNQRGFNQLCETLDREKWGFFCLLFIFSTGSYFSHLYSTLEYAGVFLLSIFPSPQKVNAYFIKHT